MVATARAWSLSAWESLFQEALERRPIQVPEVPVHMLVVPHDPASPRVDRECRVRVEALLHGVRPATFFS